MFGLSLPIVLVCIGLAIAGASVQGAMGFGMGMLTAAPLKLIEDDFVPGALLVAVIPLSFGVAVREFDAIDWRAFWAALVGRVPGTIAASFALGHLSERGLSVFLACAVLAAVVVSLTRWHIRPSQANLGVAGFASGFMGTITSVGGPPMAIAYQHGAARVRQATLAAYFGVGTVVSTTVLTIDGELGARQWELALVLLPGVAVGILLSRGLVRVTAKRWARPILLSMSAASALILLAQQA